MANFKGHALPGSFFLLFGLWWSVKLPLQQYLRTAQPDRKHTLTHSRTHTLTHSRSNTFLRIEFIEGAIKIFFSFVGIMAEQFVPDGPHAHLYVGGWVKLMNWQHSTMYLFYGISGIADVLHASPLPAPPGLDRLGLSLALFVEGFLFYFHVHNRPMLDQHVHTLLLVAVFGGSAVTLLEVFLPDQAMLQVLRPSLAILQGSWFYQIGFVLYPLNGQQWDLESHGNIMFVTMCFCWHFAVALLFVGGNYGLVWCVAQRISRRQDCSIELGLRKTSLSDSNSQKALLQESDEEQ